MLLHIIGAIHLDCLFHPVILVSRVIRKMKYCKAKGVLVVPEWKSANYWPLLSSANGAFRSYVYDVLSLPTDKGSYIPCKNGVGIFGNGDLKFPMLALYISFV